MDAQESAIYISIIVAVVAFASITSYFFYAVLKHHKKVLHLERENSKAQVEMLENDRSRIASDLHDELAPMLAAVKMRMNSFELAKDKDYQQLSKANQTIDDIAKRMRSISFDLMPATLDEKGLQIALSEFAHHVSSDCGPKIQLLLCAEPLDLSKRQTIHIYRIIQEMIHNTIKHSDANELIISVSKERNHLIVYSEDNGIGFDYQSKLNSSKGLGLKSLQKRAQLLEAELTIKSSPGKGTTITIRIPTATTYEYILHQSEGTACR